MYIIHVLPNEYLLPNMYFILYNTV
uniref:Uncharacterized protein n=1 Tax=Anguilla anguilla TaxID=7936 RepID=A0A0E9UPM4_ANGAN